MADRRVLRGAALVVVAALALLAVVFHRDNPLSRAAQDYAQTVAAASAGTYVTLRTLNAMLSTAQEVEVNASLGVGGSAQPLKFLEPIDDTVERVAGAVFALMLASGILAVAMGPVGALGWAMIGLACLVRLAGRGAGGAIARPLFGYGLFLGAALPLAFIGAALLSDWLTQEVWARHSAVIGEITAQVEVERAPVREAEGWFGDLREVWAGLGRYQDLAANIYDRADELVGSFIAILSVFVFRIFVLPALLIGVFLALARGLSRRTG